MADGWLDAPVELRDRRIWVAGHAGMVGSALVRRLQSEHCEILSATRQALDFRRQAEVEEWMAAHKPEVVVIAAAKVGGILRNTNYPAEFLYDNLMIETNIIHAAKLCGVRKLLFLGSSCVFPKMAAQPITEDALLSGPLEPTNEAYAIAKIAGIKLCEAYRNQYGRDFISAMPCNVYGPGDNFDLLSSHVIPAIMRKAHEAKFTNAPTLSVWGSGTPSREFLYVDDLADALIFLLKNYSGERLVNIGTGSDMTIAALAQEVADVVGFKGAIVFDPSKPDGTSRKLMDSGRIYNAGWRPRMSLRDGLAETYRWFKDEWAAREVA